MGPPAASTRVETHGSEGGTGLQTPGIEGGAGTTGRLTETGRVVGPPVEVHPADGGTTASPSGTSKEGTGGLWTLPHNPAPAPAPAPPCPALSRAYRRTFAWHPCPLFDPPPFTPYNPPITPASVCVLCTLSEVVCTIRYEVYVCVCVGGVCAQLTKPLPFPIHALTARLVSVVQDAGPAVERLRMLSCCARHVIVHLQGQCWFPSWHPGRPRGGG